MIPTILKDAIPRQLAYPLGEAYLSDVLGAETSVEDLGLFFLFTSGIQLDHYDPLTSKEVRYPVMALDRDTPPLVGTAEAQLRDALRRKAELAGLVRTSALTPRGRADAESGPTTDAFEDTLADLSAYEAAIVVFPVKTRMRRRVADAFEDDGLKLIRNWLAVPPDTRATQKPLVLYFDETNGTLSARFAKQEGPRRLYR